MTVLLAPSSRPMSKQPHTRLLKQGDITGQCSNCLDVFSVSVYVHKHKVYASESSRLKWIRDEEGQICLVHRPGMCNGRVKLYGTLDRFFPAGKPQSGEYHQTVFSP